MTNGFRGKPSSPLLMQISQGWIGRSAGDVNQAPKAL